MLTDTQVLNRGLEISISTAKLQKFSLLLNAYSLITRWLLQKSMHDKLAKVVDIWQVNNGVVPVSGFA